jgi:nitroimidazol reductase NimA-like FMN-containing flavoprotein (pyridoxamine 5'-phosphate oxidase superfamily)
MEIREMSNEECLHVLAGARLARLACAHENQPYVVPVYLAYHEASGCLYGFTTPGQKVEWMRANPLVCVVVDEIAAYNQWVSVIVVGRYEELPEAIESDDARLRAQERPRQVAEAISAWSADSRHCQCDDERQRAWQLLKTHPGWVEPGCTAWAARAHRDSAEPFISVYYRIRIDRVTGHEATRDARDAISYTVSAPLAGRWSRLRRTLTRVFGGRSKEAGSAS